MKKTCKIHRSFYFVFMTITDNGGDDDGDDNGGRDNSFFFLLQRQPLKVQHKPHAGVDAQQHTQKAKQQASKPKQYFSWLSPLICKSLR